jgi:UDP-N-acetylmuramate dehydrogenase
MKDNLLFEIKEKLNQKSIPFRESILLAPLSSFKIGGISPLVIEPENSEQLLDSILILSAKEAVYKILGGGSNLLISDTPDDFIIIRLSGEFKEYKEIEAGRFKIGSAMNNPNF